MTQIFINTAVITLILTEFSIRIELFFTENMTPDVATVKWVIISWLQKFVLWTEHLLKFFMANQQLL